MSARSSAMFVALLVLPLLVATATETRATVDKSAVEATAGSLIEKHGAVQEQRIRRGVGQVAGRWWSVDGDAESFSSFCLENFISDGAQLNETFLRLQEPAVRGPPFEAST